MILFGVVAHGGVGSPAEDSDKCKDACERAFQFLQKGSSALEVALEAAVILEDSGNFNAGCGSLPRFDGKTVEMDAAVMDSSGNMGVVIGLRGFRNPVRVARKIMDTPHIALSGRGAESFAKKGGFLPFPGMSPQALKKVNIQKQLIREGKAGILNPLWRGYDVNSLWNSDNTAYRDVYGTDTIGVVVVDRQGSIAVAVSTGGASPMMIGRVGDAPMVGCGFYTGPACAVAATGIGEEIIKKMLAKHVYDKVASGEDMRKVCESAINLFPEDIPVGLIAISQHGFAINANREMASFARVEEE